MGWNKSMLIDDEVNLTFNFSDTRIMFFVDIHTNNMFTKDVQVMFYNLSKKLFFCLKCVKNLRLKYTFFMYILFSHTGRSIIPF